ncbi:MAG: sulfotransferase [Myxococcota bacterium]
MIQVKIDQSEPVFILGCPRSGTSVLSWAVAAHDAFWTSAESDIMHLLFGGGHLHRSFKEAYDRPDGGWLFKNKVTIKEFYQHLGVGIDLLFQSRAGGRRWVDATPGHTLMARELAMLFPRARFLNIVRDGRSVVSSMQSSGFGTSWSDNFKVACSTWSHYVESGLRFQTEEPERVLEVRNERLRSEPAAEMKRIYEFLGVEDDPRGAELLSTKRINSSYGNEKPADVKKVKDPNAAPVAPWSDWTRGMKREFEKQAGETMRTLGYGDD